MLGGCTLDGQRVSRAATTPVLEQNEISKICEIYCTVKKWL
jgi:hypothetical protein